MKRIIVMISVLLLISGGILFSNRDSETPIPPSRIIEFQGRIQALMTDIPAVPESQDSPPVAFIKIKVKDEKTNMEHSVQIAPGDFLRLNSVFLKKDDQIRIKGFRGEMSEEIKSMEIEIQGKILVVRDRFGNGLWEKPELRPKKSGFLNK